MGGVAEEDDAAAGPAVHLDEGHGVEVEVVGFGGVAEEPGDLPAVAGEGVGEGALLRGDVPGVVGEFGEEKTKRFLASVSPEEL
ncbi:hypothetical protein STANM309S_06348 [Streptomyces tanashiensis]